MKRISEKIFLIFLSLFILVGCSKEHTAEKLTEEIEVANLPPSAFNLTVKDISYDKATIRWSESIDPENDIVNYSVYLNEELVIEEITDLEYKLEELAELSLYSGKVIAKDINNNTSEQTFSFETEKFYLRFLKAYNYNDEPPSRPGGNPYTIIKTFDNNYIVAGESNFSGNGAQFFILKTDYYGNEIWKYFYPYQLGDSWDFNTIESSNGLLLVGHHHILSLDHNGEMIWYKKLDSYDIPDASAEIKSVAQDTDGNIFVIGGRGSNEAQVIQEAVITKIDLAGNTVWEKSFTPSIRNFFNDILITSSNELMILGSTETDSVTFEQHIHGNEGQIDFWIMKLSNDGEEIWNKTYGDERYDFPEEIIKKSNGNYIFAGFAWDQRYVSNGRIFEIDQNGDEIWNKTTDLSYIFSIAETLDNGLIATGQHDFGLTRYGSMGISKYDAYGNEKWSQYHRETTTYLRGYSIIAEEDGGYRIAGKLSQNYYYGDEAPKILIYKTDPFGYFID